MIIYKITNLINGKIYIGQTKFTVEKRFKEHAKADSPLGHAIRKYGKKNFKAEVIETCQTFTELNEREIFWIKEFNCKVPNGYNIADGGAFYAVKKVDGEYYFVKTDENGEIIGYFLLTDKFIDKVNDKRYYVKIDDDGNIKGYFPIKDKNLGKDWLALFQNPSIWLAKQKMTGEQSSVLWYLLGRLDFENFLRVSRTEIAETLQMQPVNVSRAMKVLKEKNIIVEGLPAGKFKTYRLNPNIGYKGKNRNENILSFEDELAKKGKNFLNADFTTD